MKNENLFFYIEFFKKNKKTFYENYGLKYINYNKYYYMINVFNKYINIM